MPLGYEVFAGNRTDVTTVEEIVEQMEKRYGLVSARIGSRPISWCAFWLMSCGRRWSSGRAAPGWATVRGLFSMNLGRIQSAV
jgi:hypothetical protein